MIRRRRDRRVGCRVNREPFPHLARDAHLFGRDDLRDGARHDDEPEEEGRRERRRVVSREDQVVENQSEGKVEDVGRSANEVVEPKDAVECAGRRQSLAS